MKYKFLLEHNNGFEEVVVTCCYYTLGFLRELQEWLSNKDYVEGHKELDVLLGDLSENIRDLKIGDGGAQHIYIVIGNIVEKLKNNDDVSVEVEDFQFYCGEFLRGIESVLKLGEDFGKLLGTDMSSFCWEHLDRNIG